MLQRKNGHVPAWEDAFKLSQADAVTADEPAGWIVTACSVMAGLLTLWFLAV